MATASGCKRATGRWRRSRPFTTDDSFYAAAWRGLSCALVVGAIAAAVTWISAAAAFQFNLDIQQFACHKPGGGDSIVCYLASCRQQIVTGVTVTNDTEQFGRFITVTACCSLRSNLVSYFIYFLPVLLLCPCILYVDIYLKHISN